MSRLTKRQIVATLVKAIEHEDEVGGDYDELYDTICRILRKEGLR